MAFMILINVHAYYLKSIKKSYRNTNSQMYVL